MTWPVAFLEREELLAMYPERDADPRDDLTGWEKPAFVCGCGRGCASWPDHHARIDQEDVADEMDARRERAEGSR